MAKASEEAYNPSYIHPAKRSAFPSEIVESVRRKWVKLVVSSKDRGFLCRVTGSPPSTEREKDTSLYLAEANGGALIRLRRR